jgi:hypothetical protein
MLEEVRHLFASVFPGVDDHFGALCGPFRDILAGVLRSMVGKRERFFGAIGGYDDECFRALIDFLHSALGNIETALANFVYFDCSFFRATLGVVRDDFGRINGRSQRYRQHKSNDFVRLLPLLC